MKKGTLFLNIALFVCLFFMTAESVHAQSAVSGQRIAGSDRYETSSNISKAGWTKSSDTGIAVIATGKDFPDALSAAPLAKKFNAPILLTGSNTLEPALSSELTRLMIKQVYIVGGPGVISQNIENGLKAMGITCKRLYGKDRYETSAAVANELGPSDRVVIATGENFPDALSIAPWAASSGIPILLTETKKLSPAIEEYIKKSSVVNSYVIGGTGVIDDAVVSNLKNPQRIWGNDRFETNVAVLNTFAGEFDFNKMYLATGNDFPDALSGSALAALTKSPIILTDKGPLAATKAYIDSNISRINEVYIIGGEGVVSDSAINGVIPPIVTKVEIALPAPSVGINKEIKAEANVTMIPSNAAKPPVVFTVSDANTARISEDGTITGLKVGNVRVTASVGDKSSNTNLLVRLDKLIVLDPGHGGSSIGAVPTAEDGVTKLLDYREAVLNIQIVQRLKWRLEALGAKVVETRQGDTYISLEDRAKLANDLNADWFISIHHNSASNKAATGTSTYYSTYKPEANGGSIYVLASGEGPVYDLDGKPIGNVTEGSMYEYVDSIINEKGQSYIQFKFNDKTAKVLAKSDYIIVKDNTLDAVVRQSGEMARIIKDSMLTLGLDDRGTICNDFAVNRLTKMTSVLVEVGFISNYEEFRKITQPSFQDNAAEKIVRALVDIYESSQSPSPGLPATP